MRVNQGFLGWGVFLLIAGAIPLAVRAGLITEDQVGNVGSLWPLILIGIGVAVLLSRTRLAVVGGLVVASTFGVIVGGVLAGGVGNLGLGACGPIGSNTTPFETRDGTFDDSSAIVGLELDCGDLTLTAGAGNGWTVAGDGPEGRGPTIDAERGSLRVASSDGGRDWFSGLNRREAWRVTLPQGVGLDLAVDINAGSADVDLGAASIRSLDLSVNAGSVVVDLGAADELGDLQIELNAGALDLTLPDVTFEGSIEGNASSVNLCTPPGAGLRLNTEESIVAAYNYDGQGLVKNGTTWETPGFDTAEVRIELDTRANAGSFSLNPEEGCGG